MFKTFLAMFAKPLGGMVNNALAAGGGSAVLWATSHGIADNIATAVVGAGVLFLSQLISGFAATQGVQIPVINADSTNGVVVVKSSTAGNAQVVNGPLADPSRQGGG